MEKAGESIASQESSEGKFFSLQAGLARLVPSCS
jgi:hypothetical protein